MTIRHFTLALLPAAALAAEPTLVKGAGGIEDKRLHATASLSTSVGQATFVQNDNADNPSVGQSLSLGPSYTLTDKLTLGLGWSIGWEYTNPDPPGNTTGRRYSPSDISGSISHSELWSDDVTGLSLSGSLRAIAPTSFESRGANTLTNVSASPKLAKSFGDKLSLTYGLGFTKYFPLTEAKGSTGTKVDDDGIPLCLDSEREGGGCQGGLNTNFTISNTIGASYTFTDKLSGSLSLGLAHGWKIAPEGVSWTEQRRLDSTSGSLEVSYTIDETYSISGGISSGQPALDERGSRPRFPLFDFETPANGFTTFGVTLSGKI